MSSYTFKAKHKTTGKTLSVDALDDYFGHHEYGYRLQGSSVVSNEKTFNKFYERIEDEETPTNYKIQPKVRIKETGEVKEIYTLEYSLGSLDRVSIIGDWENESTASIKCFTTNEIDFITDEEESYEGNGYTSPQTGDNTTSYANVGADRNYTDKKEPLETLDNTEDFYIHGKISSGTTTAHRIKMQNKKWPPLKDEDLPEPDLENAVEYEPDSKVSSCCGANVYPDLVSEGADLACPNCLEPCEAVKAAPECDCCRWDQEYGYTHEPCCSKRQYEEKQRNTKPDPIEPVDREKISEIIDNDSKSELEKVADVIGVLIDKSDEIIERINLLSKHE